MKFGAGAMEGFLIGKRRWTALAASVVTLRRLTPFSNWCRTFR